MESNTSRTATLEADQAPNTGGTEPTDAQVGGGLPSDSSLASGEAVDSPKEGAANSESNKIADKYSNIDGFVKGYKSLQEGYRQTATELSQLKAALKEIELKSNKEKLDAMTDSEKLEWLTKQYFDNSRPVENSESQVNFMPTEDPEVESFIASNKELEDYGLSDLFRELANSEKFKNFTVESIYNIHLKPMINRIAGTKVTETRRPISPALDANKTGVDGITDAASFNKWLESLSIEEYNANRVKIIELANKFNKFS